MVEGRTPRSWHSLSALPAVALVTGLAVTIGLVLLVDRLEERVARARIELEAKQRALALGKELEAAENALHSVASLFASTENEVSREEFRAFVGPIFERHPHIQAIGFDPAIPHAQREAHELQARRQGLPDYRITDRERQGEMVPAAERPVYYPVFYMEPSEGNGAALGFDIGSEPRRSDALTRASATGRFAATAPITLVQEQGEQLALLGVIERQFPDGDGGAAGLPRSDGRMRGYVVGVFRMASLARDGLAAFAPDNMTVQVFDTTDPDDPQILLSLGAHAASDYDQVSVIPFGGRTYSLTFRPTRAFREGMRDWVPTATAVVGLASSLLVALFLRLLIRHGRRVEQLVALGQDELLQRQQAEALLRTSEERLELTLNAVSDGGWDWDIASGRVTFSDAWLASLGFARGELPEQFSAWEQLLYPDDVAPVRAAREAHLAGETPIYECENRLGMRSGDYRPNLSRGKVVAWDDSGTPLRMVGTDTDITRLKQEQAERAAALAKLQQSQKLESLGVVVGGIAHDFNNLLTGILGNAELARRTLPPQEIDARLQQIEVAGRRASELTHEMLAYAGRGTFELEDLDLSTLASELPQLVQASLTKKATLLKDLDEGGAWVRADAAQLRQVFMNLLINASDALEGKPGEISLRTGVVVLGRDELANAVLGKDHEPGRYAFVEVRDSGAGMSEEVQERVFDPFFSTKSSGRGLGLAAVIGIVRWHNGVIRLESSPGHGTTFRVLLPAVERPAAQSPADVPSSVSPPRLSGRVLVVDDEPGVRMISAAGLAEVGLDVLEAEDGAAGLAAFQQHAASIDLAVLDMSMPKMSGVELALALRGLRADLPIVIVSGYAEPEDLASLPGVRFLAKPFGLETLVDVTREVLSKAAVRSSGSPGGAVRP